MAETRNRSGGNPNQRPTDREAGRVGRSPDADDLPVQKAGLVCVRGGNYRLGIPERPAFTFDNGFLDRFPRRSATPGDYAQLVKWRATLEAGEAFRPDLSDALAAYRHFLDGKGKPRTFSYERYVINDASGRITLASAIDDIEGGILDLWATAGQPGAFSVTGTGIACGSSHPDFPYPQTENWQKAIGAHQIWLSAIVTASFPTGTEPQFEMLMTLHAEDRYNFNPGAADIATGIPDNANGVFELTGLAQQFDQTATLTRRVSWAGRSCSRVRSSDRPHPSRERQPTGNRRLRNRV